MTEVDEIEAEAAAPNRPFLSRAAAALVAPRGPWVLPALALAVLLTTFLFTAQSYFNADDFLFAAYFDRYPLDLDALTRSWFGHFMPGYVFADALFLKLFGMAWPLAGIVIALVHTGAYVAFVRCLDATIGRVRTNPLLGLAFTFAVGVVTTRLWWAATLNNMLALALALATLGCLVRWLRTKRLRHLVAMLVVYAGALSVSEKSLLFSLYAVLWVLLVVWRGEPVKARLRSLLRAWPAWAGIAVLSLADIGVFLTGQYVTESGASPSIGDMVTFVLWGIGGGFVPSLFGFDMFVIRPDWGLIAVVITCLVLVAAVVLSVLRRPSAGGAWIFVAVAVFANQSVLARRAELIGLDVSRLPRYQLEGTALFWLGMGVVVFLVLSASGPARHQPTGSRSRVPVRMVAGLAAVGVLASFGFWAYSTAANVRTSYGHAAKAWVENLKQSYPGQADAAFLRFPVVDAVSIPGLYPYNMSDYVLPPLLEGVRFSDQLDGSLIADLTGEVGPAEFVPASDPVTVGSCAADGAGLSLPQVSGTAGSFLVLDFDGAVPGTLTVQQGYQSNPVITDESGRLVVYLGRDLAAGTLTVSNAGGPICIQSVTVGSLVRADS